jgi:hypothetical protein
LLGIALSDAFDVEILEGKDCAGAETARIDPQQLRLRTGTDWGAGFCSGKLRNGWVIFRIYQGWNQILTTAIEGSGVRHENKTAHHTATAFGHMVIAVLSRLHYPLEV